MMLDLDIGVAALRGWKLALAMLAAVAGLGAAAASVAAWLGDRRLERTLDVRVVPLPFTQEPASIRLGAQLYQQRGCVQCHGEDGAGRVTIDNDNGLYVRAPNITLEAGTPTATYSEGDWVRAIRHGVSQQGRALLFMPCEEYSRLTDTELAALVAYVRNLPPHAGDGTDIRLPFHLKALYGAGLMPSAADRIDHRKPPAP
jgi:mono/diheme cytochrome c family protein